MTSEERHAKFNGSTMISIWRNDKSYTVALCDKPHTGFREKTFNLQRDAVAHAKAAYPSFEIWKELPDSSYLRIQEGI